MFPALRRSFIQLGTSFMDLVYPPFCLHCEDCLYDSSGFFCSHCVQQLELLDHKERCPFCFTAEFNRQHEACCGVCRRQQRLLDGMAASFEYEGPAATLVKRLKYGGLPYLSKGAAAFLVAQFVRLQWPFPDYIVPVPMDTLKRLDRGYNQSALLAEAFAKMVDRPVMPVLKRAKGSFSQAGLSYKQRMQMASETFCAKETALFRDKCILLIDDVTTTGSTLRCCAEALHGLHPKFIYALSVCRAL